MRTRLNVTLYVNCLSCWMYNPIISELPTYLPNEPTNQPTDRLTNEPTKYHAAESFLSSK